MTVGSKEWCKYWTNWYWNQACKFSRNKYPLDEIFAMECMFKSYMWNDTKPWVK